VSRNITRGPPTDPSVWVPLQGRIGDDEHQVRPGGHPLVSAVGSVAKGAMLQAPLGSETCRRSRPRGSRPRRAVRCTHPATTSAGGPCTSARPAWPCSSSRCCAASGHSPRGRGSSRRPRSQGCQRARRTRLDGSGGGSARTVAGTGGAIAASAKKLRIMDASSVRGGEGGNGGFAAPGDRSRINGVSGRLGTGESRRDRRHAPRPLRENQPDDSSIGTVGA
jgi:hypothetical protein